MWFGLGRTDRLEQTGERPPGSHFIPAGVVLLGKFFHGHMKGGVVLRAHPALRLGQLAPDPEPPHSDVHTIVFGRRD